MTYAPYIHSDNGIDIIHEVEPNTIPNSWDELDSEEKQLFKDLLHCGCYRSMRKSVASGWNKTLAGVRLQRKGMLVRSGGALWATEYGEGLYLDSIRK